MDQIVSNLVARVSWAGVKDGRVMWDFNARVSAPGDSAVKWGNQSNRGAEAYSYQWNMQADIQHPYNDKTGVCLGFF